MREPLLGLLQRDGLIQNTADLTEFTVLAGGDAEEHLLNEVGLGLGKAGGKHPRMNDAHAGANGWRLWSVVCVVSLV